MSDISVIICTHTEERWDFFHAALASVRRQSFPALETIVVVDHNQALQERLTSVLPEVRVVENLRQRGLSGARNTGIAVARGEIIAFLDDDAAADADWLKRLADCFSDPDVRAVGGLTLPLWQTRRPPWFPEEFDWVVGCTYTGMPTFRAPVRNVMGGNAAFRRDVFELAGGFRTGIGRSTGSMPLGCEETELCIRLRQRLPNSVVLFDNRAVIWHHVPDARCQFSYFLARCYAEGLSKSLVTANVGMRDGLSAERRYAFRTLPAGIARGAMDFAHGRTAGAGRAGAMLAGLTAGATGYVTGVMRAALARVLTDGRADGRPSALGGHR